MKNKTLAIFGIATYILSVFSYAEDLQGNYVAPVTLVLVAALATIVFTIMATIRLWKTRKIIAILFLVSSAVTLVFTITLVRGFNTIMLIWVVIILWKMGGKKRVTYQVYCNASVEAALEHTDEATLKEFRQACSDSALNAVDSHILQNHMRALFIEMLLIAIAKSFRMEVGFPAQMFVNQKLKELNLIEVSYISSTYSHEFASPDMEDLAMGIDGIRNMVIHFNNVVCEGQLKQETIDRLDTELHAVLESHYRDFKHNIKLIS